MFATSINCIDGRVQLPINGYLKEKLGVYHIDNITIPGVNKVLADNLDKQAVEMIRKSVLISVNAHGSKIVAVSGHHDCKGNPTERPAQDENTRKAMELIESWGLGVDVIGLWIDQNWQVTELSLI